MLKMAQIEYIKHLYEVEGKSISYIAKTLQLNRRTATKYAGKYNWTPLEKPLEERRYPVLGPYIKVIDEWLEEDKKSPRKQRHSGYRVYKRLVACNL
jgi:transposase